MVKKGFGLMVWLNLTSKYWTTSLLVSNVDSLILFLLRVCVAWFYYGCEDILSNPQRGFGGLDCILTRSL